MTQDQIIDFESVAGESLTALGYPLEFVGKTCPARSYDAAAVAALDAENKRLKGAAREELSPRTPPPASRRKTCWPASAAARPNRPDPSPSRRRPAMSSSSRPPTPSTEAPDAVPYSPLRLLADCIVLGLTAWAVSWPCSRRRSSACAPARLGGREGLS